MDRQQTLLQEQANKWLEQQKCGFTTEQEEQFQYWLSLNPDHKTIFEESKQIDGLLAQFSEQEIENLSTSKVFRFSNSIFSEISGSSTFFGLNSLYVLKSST